jgi:hypothetical protein
MKQSTFAPGFRLSLADGFVLLGGVTAIIILSKIVLWWGFVLGFVLGHFFLFCNVVRMARPFELLWSGIFVVLAGATVVLGTPGWLVTALLSLVVTGIVVVVKIRKPSYHGVGWKWINPGLPAWWESRIAERTGG